MEKRLDDNPCRGNIRASLVFGLFFLVILLI